MRPSNNQDVIDSRDVIEAIAELEDERDMLENPDGWDGREELEILQKLADVGETLADWAHGVTLVRDDHFVRYARELAHDIGAVREAAEWPLSHIDWDAAATALQSDYTSLDFDGVTYWTR